MNTTYTLQAFVADLRRITGEETDPEVITSAVLPLLQQLAVSQEIREREWKEPDPEQGFGFELLHEEPDHTLVVALLTWLPGRITPPHDHGTWGVIVGIEGEEINTFWRRVDDGSQEGYVVIEKESEVQLLPGTSLVLMPRSIHSIENRGDRINVSLHTYGIHTNHTDRSQFDPENHIASSWKIKE